MICILRQRRRQAADEIISALHDVGSTLEKADINLGAERLDAAADRREAIDRVPVVRERLDAALAGGEAIDLISLARDWDRTGEWRSGEFSDESIYLMHDDGENALHEVSECLCVAMEAQAQKRGVKIDQLPFLQTYKSIRNMSEGKDSTRTSLKKGFQRALSRVFR